MAPQQPADVEPHRAQRAALAVFEPAAIHGAIGLGTADVRLDGLAGWNPRISTFAALGIRSPFIVWSLAWAQAPASILKIQRTANFFPKCYGTMPLGPPGRPSQFL